MCRIVTVIHQKDSVLENMIIKRLSKRRTENKDKVVIVNYGDDKIESSLRHFDIIGYKGKTSDLRNLDYNSAFIDLPMSKIDNHMELLYETDLIILSSINSVVSLSDFRLASAIFNKPELFDKTTLIFEA